MTTEPSPAAQDLARRLLARETPEGDAPDAVAAAIGQACGRVSENLARWVGTEGSNALFARALARARADHPALSNVRYTPQSAFCLDGLAESARLHGEGAATAAMLALLTALIDLLGRLIGEDLAMRLVEQSVPAVAPDDARATEREGEP